MECQLFSLFSFKCQFVFKQKKCAITFLPKEIKSSSFAISRIISCNGFVVKVRDKHQMLFL